MSDIAVKYVVADSLVLLQQPCVSLQLRAIKPNLKTECHLEQFAWFLFTAQMLKYINIIHTKIFFGHVSSPA